MAFTYDADGLRVDQPCKDPGQRGWADYLDNLAQDIRDGRVAISTLQQHLENKTILIYYKGETTK